MGRRSGRADAGDALDLFLDAICNTFGGVLFIALLVCVMLANARTEPDKAHRPQDYIEARRLQLELDHEQTEIERNTAHLEWLQTQVEEQAGQYDPQLTRRYADLSSEKKILSEERPQIERQLSTLRRDLNKSKRRLDELDQRSKQHARELAKVESKLNETTRRATNKVRLPLAQKTSKEEVPVFVAGGRMSFVLRYDQRGKATAINSADVLVNNLPPSVRPRAGKGLLVEDTDRWRAALRRQLTVFKPARDYLLLAVWPDSYAQFELLRDQLVEMGYNYGILLPKEGEWIGSGGGSNPIQG